MLGMGDFAFFPFCHEIKIAFSAEIENEVQIHSCVGCWEVNSGELFEGDGKLSLQLTGKD